MNAATNDPVYTAVVHAIDGTRFVASAQCPQHLTAQVVAYISERCDDVLWPVTAAQVHAFIDANQPYAAIALYFAEVGERWDEERLELGGLSYGVPGLRASRLAEAS